jgi:hypothetical protein
MSTNGKRSASELRSTLAKNREQIDADLSELGNRFHEALNPRHLLSRHPILTAGAGAVLGFLIVRRPTQVMRAASRLVGLGAPLLLSALLKGDGSASVPEPPTNEND